MVTRYVGPFCFVFGRTEVVSASDLEIESSCSVGSSSEDKLDSLAGRDCFLWAITLSGELTGAEFLRGGIKLCV